MAIDGMYGIENGMTARDSLTGFEGTVTGVVQYFTGCNQVLLSPNRAEDNKRPVSEWFDVERIIVVDSAVVSLPNGPTPGGRDEPLPSVR